MQQDAFAFGKGQQRIPIPVIGDGDIPTAHRAAIRGKQPRNIQLVCRLSSDQLHLKVADGIATTSLHKFEPVEPGAATQAVLTGTAVQGVVIGATKQAVVAAAAIKHRVAGHIRQIVVTRITIGNVIAHTGEEPVIAGTAIKQIIAQIAVQRIAAVATIFGVVAIAARDMVGARAPRHKVIAAARRDIQRRRAGRAIDRIGKVGALHGLDLAKVALPAIGRSIGARFGSSIGDRNASRLAGERQRVKIT